MQKQIQMNPMNYFRIVYRLKMFVQVEVTFYSPIWTSFVVKTYYRRKDGRYTLNDFNSVSQFDKSEQPTSNIWDLTSQDKLIILQGLLELRESVEVYTSVIK